MATLALCDLCGGKVKRDFVHLNMTGRMEMYKGRPPEPPPGFRYQESDDEQGKVFVKTWDAFGKLISEMRLMPKPPKWRQVQVSYDLCEDCSSKMIMLLESLRSKYHLEKKEIQMLDVRQISPWKLLGFEDSEKWQQEDEDE